MTPPPPALIAARAVLQAHADAVGDDVALVERSALLLAEAGLPVPEPLDPVEALHAALAAAVGARDVTGAVDLLDRHLPSPAGRWLLESACLLAGPRWPDVLVDVARRHPDRHFVGPLLAATSEPGALLDLLPPVTDDPVVWTTVATVGEVVIAGRDRGRPHDDAERQWTAITRQSPEHLAAYRDAALRMAVREDLEGGIELLQRWGEQMSRRRIVVGAHAVLARLARHDPDRAVEIATVSRDPWDRAAWLDGLAWWLELVPPAVPVVTGLLDHGDSELDLTVARVLSGTTELDLLDRALVASDDLEPLDVATSLAAGAARLWRAGPRHVAEQVRRRCLPYLSNEPGPGDSTSAVDVFEVYTATGPPAVPWEPSPPGVP